MTDRSAPGGERRRRRVRAGVEIPSDQLGDGEIRVQQKQEDGSFAGLDCDIEKDFDTVTITMDEPAGFRVQF